MVGVENMWEKIRMDEKGFTGLEAAIVLIAFVVVAAVFSYVMLGAGFFTTQKSQEVVHTGVQQASSSIELAGDVVVKGDDTIANAVDTITFYVTVTAGSTPVDLDKTIISYKDDDEFFSKIPWAYASIVREPNEFPADNLVEKNELYKITVYLDKKVTAVTGESVTITTGSGSLTNFPVIPGTLSLKDASNNYYMDDGNGNIVQSDGTDVGDIDYSTGAITTTLADGTYTANYRYTEPGTAGTDYPSSLPQTNEKIQLELKPPTGATLVIVRTLPAELSTNDYYVVY
ncbi:archaeal flagellin N-terminal-like domain protein [Archaeoglobus sulfaticallidus PM70-1]|uniref:Flagellin n=1 Tax=Archaeoglobus sulfaticallidus PM70-1 TaxID=387631 RepID=N0BK23_9EURY|nr:archaellin/type IV pilin N-terminal domain-containing protein [Archaeoglobus sulfaticallidus]AGK60851.1 archaeal flagellin N-terminal-like domain protein [Archaeoglobus sulfaticallidus PM70-1]